MRKYAAFVLVALLAGGCEWKKGAGGNSLVADESGNAPLAVDTPQPHSLSTAETCIALYLEQQRARDKSLNIAAPEVERLGPGDN